MSDLIQVKKFDELTNKELYQILKLRFDVFVIEQQCIYPEFDDVDYDAEHFFIEKENEVVGYLRAYKKSDKAAFGRLVVREDCRDLKYGSLLVKKCLNYLHKDATFDTVFIQAQTYLSKFYASFGFKPISEPYDDEGILHVDMELQLP